MPTDGSDRERGHPGSPDRGRHQPDRDEHRSDSENRQGELIRPAGRSGATAPAGSNTTARATKSAPPASSPSAEGRGGGLLQKAESRGVPLRTILAAATVAAVFYLAAKLAYRLRELILLMVLAVFVTGLLSPLVDALQRWRIKRRGLAVTVVVMFSLLVFIGLAFTFGVPLAHGTAHLARTLPSYVNSLVHGRGWLGHLARKYHLQAWVRQNTPKIVSVGQGLTRPALSLGRGAVSVVAALLTLFILVTMLLLEGPAIWNGLLGTMAPERAERYSRIARKANRSAAGYMTGNLITSIIAGTVVLVALLATGVPYPFLWALWVALVDFLPMIGGALAGIPTVLFAAGHSLLAGIVTLVVFIVYQQIENHILNPIVMGRTARVSPLLVLVSVLVGGSLGDWVGGTFGAFVAAVLAVPTAAAIQAVVREIRRSTTPDRSPPPR